jgi:hypothetical protein
MYDLMNKTGVDRYWLTWGWPMFGLFVCIVTFNNIVYQRLPNLLGWKPEQLTTETVVIGWCLETLPLAVDIGCELVLVTVELWSEVDESSLPASG